jgi:Leucine-rich repeat (LRR) protein
MVPVFLSFFVFPPGSIEILNLSNNNGLSGTIPTEYLSLPSIQSLQLGGNFLTGKLPTSYGGATSTLEILEIHTNFLTGPIPKEMGQLTVLRRLNLSTNAPLTGTLPSELGSLQRLEILDLSGNQFNGTIPTQLGSITALQQVTLGKNMLTGSVPAEVCAIASDTNLQLETLVVDCGGTPPPVSCDCCSSCANAAR